VATSPSSRRPPPRPRHSRVELGSINNPKPGWTLPDALRMLEQGYAAEHVSRLTGYAEKFLLAQRPRRDRSRSE